MIHGGIEGFNGCVNRNLEADKNTYTQSDPNDRQGRPQFVEPQVPQGNGFD